MQKKLLHLLRARSKSPVTTQNKGKKRRLGGDATSDSDLARILFRLDLFGRRNRFLGANLVRSLDSAHATRA